MVWVASGGVAGLPDVVACAALRRDGVRGVIAGRAIYEGHLDVAEALRTIASLVDEDRGAGPRDGPGAGGC